MGLISDLHAVLFFLSDDPDHNTSAPVGELAESGWAWQGAWGDFLGTTIAPHYFITAAHIGGTVGNKFVLDGKAYSTTAFFDDPESDLRVCKVREAFPAYASLYSKEDEVGKGLVVFGRGAPRGQEVTVVGPSGPRLKGWRWGTGDGRLRWGENRVGEVIKVPETGPDGVSTNGRVEILLRMPFDPVTRGNEADLSAGDSGGGVFLRDEAGWKLAGINRAADGPYRIGEAGSGFWAAIFDEGGLSKGGEGRWRLVPDQIRDTPGGFYATRIASRRAWIQGILAQAAIDPPRLLSAALAEGPYLEETNAAVDERARLMTIAAPSESRFYRITGTSAVRISAWRVVSGKLLVEYD